MGDYTTIIDGIPIRFPYKNPYDIQIDYMKRVLKALKEGQHAILESPTGTGKTLSLLCATLGWISQQKEMVRAWTANPTEDLNNDDDNKQDKAAASADKDNAAQNNTNGTHGNSSGLATDKVDEAVPMEKIPQVIYASRTHSQLTQAMRELRKSPYKDIKAGVFASRAQLCINPNVKKSANAMHKCRSLTKNNRCEFKNNLYAKMNQPDFKKPILDIEDLGKLGEEFDCCPYYASKELQKNAEILFMPYNYLLDPKIRDICGIDWKNAIVIFDEAHNVEKACEQTAGASITTADLCNANQELNEVFQELNEIDAIEEIGESLMFNREHVKDLQSRLLNLIGIISRNAMGSNGPLHNGGHLFNLFQSAQITNENYKGYSDLMNNLAQFLCNKGYDAKGLKKTSEFLSTAFSNSAEELKNKVDKCCKVKIEANRNSATLNFWCLNPSLATKPLFDKGIRCLIMTSGTLQPLDELETEMEIPTPIKFTNRHIIDPSQVFVNVVSTGRDGVIFDGSYDKRSDPNYLKSLGESIVDLCDSIPGGLLIFFSSYVVMDKCKTFWETRHDIWKIMSTKRDIYYEIQGESSDELEEKMKRYYKSIDEKGGAIFMAVLRGKVSEGVDFTNMYGRAVLIVSIPFAVYTDPKIVSKKDYMNSKKAADGNMITGNEWYSLDAIKPVNQAIGRVIRHKDDYGAILLCDHRYNRCDNKKHLSNWVKENPSFQKTFVDFPTMTKRLKEFFAHCEQTLPKPKSKHQSVSVRLDFDDVEDDEVPAANANSRENRKRQPTRRYSRDSPQPSTSYGHCDRADNGEKLNGTDNNSDEGEIQMKRARNGKSFMIGASSAESDNTNETDNGNEHVNPILACFKRSLSTDQYKKLVEAFNEYTKNNGSYESYRDTLFELCSGPNENSSLMGMMLLLKFEHQSMFDEDIQRKFAE